MTRYGFLIFTAATTGRLFVSSSNTPVQRKYLDSRNRAHSDRWPRGYPYPHHDQQRLTIRVTQRSQITSRRTRRCRPRHDAMFSPTAPPAGAVHCPVLTVAYVISSGHPGSQSLFPPTAPDAGAFAPDHRGLPVRSKHRSGASLTTEPVRYATLRVAWDDVQTHPPLDQAYDVNPDGEVSIPNTHLFGEQARPSTLPTRICLVDNRVLWTLDVLAMTPGGPLPNELHAQVRNWPPIVALVLEPLDGAAPPKALSMGTFGDTGLLERHICVWRANNLRERLTG